jgi:nitrate reductase gamma subunit
MQDQLLFAIAPWLAALFCVLALTVRYVQGRRSSVPVETVARRRHEPADGLTRWWRYSIAILFLGHLLAVVFPGGLLLWNRQPLRLIVLESVGLIAGSLALACMAAPATRREWWTQRRYAQSPSDVVAATLVLLELVSGVALALGYRWASSWSGVTLTPYLHSLVGFRPSVVLVADMPFVVKLHVFCAFAILAVMPLSGLARTLVVAIRDLAYVTLAPVTFVRRPVWYARRGWTGRVRPPLGDEEM